MSTLCFNIKKLKKVNPTHTRNIINSLADSYIVIKSPLIIYEAGNRGFIVHAAMKSILEDYHCLGYTVESSKKHNNDSIAKSWDAHFESVRKEMNFNTSKKVYPTVNYKEVVNVIVYPPEARSYFSVWYAKNHLSKIGNIVIKDFSYN